MTDVVPSPTHEEDEIMEIAAGLEAKSEHPLAEAITRYASEESLVSAQVTNFKPFPVTAYVVT